MSDPLQGVRILELGQIIAGTYGGQVLSDLGAEVIKIESPEGDLGRNPSVAPYRGVSGLFLTFNRNKKSVVIDLKTESGRAVFYDLVRVCDVVVDNFRTGVLERLKIDYPTLKAINPRVIQCSVTGFGIAGEYKDYPALDIIVQAMSGHMAITGEPGRPPVRSRENSAASMPLHAKIPPLRSASGMPTRTGGRPSSPVIAMCPLIACTMMSSAG